jgi:hypothetical protein
VEDEVTYSLLLSGYHLSNCKAYLDVSAEEMLAVGPQKVFSTSMRDVLEEYFRNHQNEERKVEGRLVYRDA